MVCAQRRATTEEPRDSERTTKMKSKINKFNPGDYERNMDVIPKKWIDHFNTTPRIIRCISDGKEEMEFFEKNDFLFGPVYWISEDDDFTYYLRAIVRDKLLEAGKEYRLVGTYIEQDMEFGMVTWEGQPEDSAEWEGFHGFPAFLFEELQPVTASTRHENADAFWEAVV